MTSLFGDGRLMGIGKEGEAVAFAFMSNLSHAGIEDVRADPVWQARDVDYRFTRMDGSTINVEVKSDRHIATTGNVLFELLRIHHSAERCAYLGWSVFSWADRLLVWCPPAERLYLFEVLALREAMQTYTQEARQSMKLRVIATDTQRTTISVLVPLALVPHRAYAHSYGAWRACPTEG